jgi:hypothetical protein
MELAHDKAAKIEVAATVKLRKLQPTTIAGVMAAAAYFAEHMDRYPGCGWIGGKIAYDDPCWFGDGLIRNLAAALAKISDRTGAHVTVKDAPAFLTGIGGSAAGEGGHWPCSFPSYLHSPSFFASWTVRAKQNSSRSFRAHPSRYRQMVP